jgi:chromosome segregation ATPase
LQDEDSSLQYDLATTHFEDHEENDELEILKDELKTIKLTLLDKEVSYKALEDVQKQQILEIEELNSSKTSLAAENKSLLTEINSLKSKSSSTVLLLIYSP